MTTTIEHRRPTTRSVGFSWLPSAALALVAATWGATFTVVDSATETLDPAALVTWRFGIAAAVLALLRRPGAAMPPTLRRRGVALGALLGLGFLLQAWALTYTDALMSGFLTSLLVVIAPVASWLIFRDRIRPATWAAIATATVGLVLLSFHATGFGVGEVLTVGSAIAWAMHLVLLSRWGRPQHAVGLATLQSATVAVMALLLVLLRATLGMHPTLPMVPSDSATWLAVGFLAVIAGALAMVLLSWSQSRLSAPRAAVLLTLEPAFAGITACLMGAELTMRTVVGGVLLLAAMLVVELGSTAAARGGHRRSVSGRRIL